MSDPLQSASPGRPFLPMPAGTWNAVLDAAKDFRRRRQGAQGGGPLVDPFSPASHVWLQNPGSSITTLAAFSVQAYGAPLLDPGESEENQYEVSRRPAVTGSTPAGAADQVCVTIEPVVGQQIGRAVSSGIALARLVVHDAAHTRAVPVAAVTDYLETAASGGYPVLHQWPDVIEDSDPEQVWALVLIGPVGVAGVGSGSGSGSGAGSGAGSGGGGAPPRCSGNVYSVTRYRSERLGDFLVQFSWLETLRYTADGCLELVRGAESSEPLGCVPCDADGPGSGGSGSGAGCAPIGTFFIAHTPIGDVDAGVEVTFSLVVISGSPGPFHYLWEINGEVSEEESPTYIFPAAGEYQVTVVIQNDCTGELASDVIIVTADAGPTPSCLPGINVPPKVCVELFGGTGDGTVLNGMRIPLAAFQPNTGAPQPAWTLPCFDRPFPFGLTNTPIPFPRISGGAPSGLGSTADGGGSGCGGFFEFGLNFAVGTTPGAPTATDSPFEVVWTGIPLTNGYTGTVNARMVGRLGRCMATVGGQTIPVLLTLEGDALDICPASGPGVYRSRLNYMPNSPLGDGWMSEDMGCAFGTPRYQWLVFFDSGTWKLRLKCGGATGEVAATGISFNPFAATFDVTALAGTCVVGGSPIVTVTETPHQDVYGSP